MAWMIAKESGAVAVSDWLAEEAGVVSAERQALVEAFRAHPPISLKLTFRAPRDPFEMAASRSRWRWPTRCSPAGCAWSARPCSTGCR
jgi:hypothetical protein